MVLYFLENHLMGLMLHCKIICKVILWPKSGMTQQWFKMVSIVPTEFEFILVCRYILTRGQSRVHCMSFLDFTFLCDLIGKKVILLQWFYQSTIWRKNWPWLKNHEKGAVMRCWEVHVHFCEVFKNICTKFIHKYWLGKIDYLPIAIFNVFLQSQQNIVCTARAPLYPHSNSNSTTFS